MWVATRVVQTENNSVVLWAHLKAERWVASRGKMLARQKAGKMAYSLAVRLET